MVMQSSWYSVDCGRQAAAGELHQPAFCFYLSQRHNKAWCQDSIDFLEQDFGVSPNKSTASACISQHLTTWSFSRCMTCKTVEAISTIRRTAWSITKPKGSHSNKTSGLSTTQALQNSSWSASSGLPLWDQTSALLFKELSRSLKAPTQQDEQQLRQVLGYIKGTLHFTTSLQPPRKRVIERASSIQIQACLWLQLGQEALRQRRQQVELPCPSVGVPLAASSRTQASQAALSSAEAELYAMGMAIHDDSPPPTELTARDAAFTASQTIRAYSLHRQLQW